MTNELEAAVKQAMEKHEVKIKQELEITEAKTKAHLDHRFDELKLIMISAFPDGDPVGHKQYHQVQIDFMNERRALWKDIRSKSIVGIIFMLLGFLGMAVIEYAKREITK